MLESLCGKVLERARMETLEEEELRIIKEQQREFEQLRNAELVEAQQLEAFESRRQNEIVPFFTGCCSKHLTQPFFPP